MKTPAGKTGDDAILTFVNAREWTAWLDSHHATSTGAWVRLGKKGAAPECMMYRDALEAAICYGWIDAQKRGESAQAWLQRFTPRQNQSIWSKINRQKALALIEVGRMMPAGLAQIERARKDGRWDAAYDSPKGATVPDDLQAALDRNPRAKAFFATLDSANRYAVLFRVQTVKLAATRARRIQQFVEMLARHEKLHP